ncbi:type 1 fimbrial protein, partial [Pseudomonas aeruginosa]
VTNVHLGIEAPTHNTAHRTNSTIHEFDQVLSGAGCTNVKKVSIAFDTVTNVDRISGNLMLMGASKAKGVEIQIFNYSA